MELGNIVFSKRSQTQEKQEAHIFFSFEIQGKSNNKKKTLEEELLGKRKG